MSESDFEKLNPQIRVAEYGVKTIKEIEIYPLAYADQEQLIDKVQTLLNAFFKADEGNDLDFAVFLIDFIKTNIAEVLRLVTSLNDRKIEALLKDVTNKQIWDIANSTYEMNFQFIVDEVKELSKNFKGLLGKMELPEKRPLQPSSSTTPDTGSSISSPSPLKTEA